MSMLQIGGNWYDLLKQTTRVLLLVVFIWVVQAIITRGDLHPAKWEGLRKAL